MFAKQGCNEDEDRNRPGFRGSQLVGCFQYSLLQAGFEGRDQVNAETH